MTAGQEIKINGPTVHLSPRVAFVQKWFSIKLQHSSISHFYEKVVPSAFAALVSYGTCRRLVICVGYTGVIVPEK